MNLNKILELSEELLIDPVNTLRQQMVKHLLQHNHNCQMQQVLLI